jgi:1-hydroxycarotenoid 3,4-desaturase
MEQLDPSKENDQLKRGFSMTQAKSTRVAVIGAGVGGLSAAALLSHQGYEVVVFERSSNIGGKAGTIQYGNFSLDTGPSLLTLKDEIKMIFKGCGEVLEEHLTLRPHSTSFRYSYPDGVSLDISDNFEVTAEAIRVQLGSHAEKEIRHFLDYSTRIWRNACPHFVLDHAPTFWNTFKKGLTGLKAVTQIDALNNMKHAIDTRVSEQHLRHILYRYATYNGSDPARAPATLNCIAHVELKLGGYGIEGGMSELPQALYRIAKSRGATFRMNSHIESINTHNKCVASLSLSQGNDEAFDAIVSNVDTRHLFNSLCPQAAPAFSTASAQERSTSAYNMLWHDPSTETQRAPHTILFPDNYNNEFEALFNKRQLPQLPTVYLCDQTLNHGKKPNENGNIVFGMINAPSVKQEQATTDPTSAFEKMAMIAKNRKFLSMKSELIWKRTPEELANAFPQSQGALYGAASNSWKSAFSRTGNHSSKINGLYIASGTAHPGGGVPMAMLSGWHAVKCMLAHESASSKNGRRAS